MNSTPTGRRLDYLKWDDYFVALMEIMSRKHCSEDRRNIALILDNRQVIIGIGHEINDDTDSPCSNHTIHQVLRDTDAFLDRTGCKLYIRNYPNCIGCINELIKNDIKQIIFINRNLEIRKEIEAILKDSNIVCEEYKPHQEQIILNLN